MPHNITKELKENMSCFKTKTIALIASSLIVAVAGLSFATTPAFAKKKNGGKHPYRFVAATKSTDSKPGAAHRGVKAAASKPAANIKLLPFRKK